MSETLSLEKETPAEIINEAIMVALSRIVLRGTKGSERRFHFDSSASSEEIGKKTELSMEGMCLEMSMNIAFELLSKNKDFIQNIFIVNSNLGKGSYKENAEFIAHSYLVVNFQNTWYAVSGANYQRDKDNFILIEGDTLEKCLSEIAEISGSQWPNAADFPMDDTADASMTKNEENQPDSYDEIASISVPVVQKNPNGVFANTQQLQVFMRRIFDNKESKMHLYNYHFLNFAK